MDTSGGTNFISDVGSRGFLGNTGNGDLRGGD